MIKILSVVVVILGLTLAHESSITGELIAEKCLRCICEMTGACHESSYCLGDVCGRYSITHPYWLDAGRLTTNGEHPDHPDSWIHCVKDEICAQATIRNYMHKFKQDCNEDGLIDCHDYALIHKYGGYGCRHQPLEHHFALRFHQCYAPSN